MKRVAILLSILSIFLAGCSSNIELNSSLTEESITASKQVDFIEFEATILNKNSFNSIKKEYQDATLQDYSDKNIAISLILSNHRENLEVIDFMSSTLDELSVKNWHILESNMGGHHVRGILIFSKSEINENPKKLTISNTPVGTVTLLFDQQKDE